MVHPAELVPSEVWNHVFSYLSVADKSCVRASCTHFRKLIDDPSLWRGWSVVLDFPNGSYDTRFWATLRRRKVTSVVLRSKKSKRIKDVASSLPALTTLVMEGSGPVDLDCLNDFKNLKSLAIRGTHVTDLSNISTVSQPQQLTHISLCNSRFCESFESISALFQFKDLTSLVFHETKFGIPFPKTKSIVASLPKLKHLSLYVFYREHDAGDREVTEPTGSQLTSLELWGRDHSLPENAMKLAPKLKRFAVFYEVVPNNTSGNKPLSVLSGLRELSTLVVVKGPPVKEYAAYIPATVTDLTLHLSKFSLEDMGAVAAQMPNLERLHLDFWPSHLGVNASLIPRLFPGLRGLKIRHKHIPEKNFLDLHRLQHLEVLEILDSHPDLPALVRRLSVLRKDRLRVLTPPRPRDVLACTCVY